MDIFHKALGVHPFSLQLRLDRAEIISGNLANVDTPGFLARDLDYTSILQQVESNLKFGEGPVLTRADVKAEHKYRIPFQPSADGNTSELSVEQANFAANSMDFQTSLTFLNMKISGLHKAIKGE
ncbi:flagellar basal body rod protein FlgB [Rheinheimera sp.]|uniref:flagellar basal body rod protein FlgB n=1 Tax=Rheinheimera sp. TaxID=1869214 RepID=UPI002FDD4220